LHKKWTRFIPFFVALFLIGTLITTTTAKITDHIKLGLDLKGGFEILYLASPLKAGGTVTKEALLETAKSLKKRVDPTGTLEPEINPENKDRIRARLAGVVDEKKVRELLIKPSYLSFKDPEGHVMLDGQDFVPDGAKVDFRDMHPIVLIQLKSADKFKDVTTQVLGKTLAIYLDDRLISNPGVDKVIPSASAEISGNFTVQEAKDLANTINMGALSLKLTEQYTQSIGATLGLKSLEQTVHAGFLAFVIILIGMIFVYRLPGIIASFTLVVYAWLLLLVLVILHATLTLPGIAAFVLGIGMSVDANIITYERIKEEIRSGKSIKSSFITGSKRSLRTIMDANVTTLIAAAVLFYIGTGSIRGFALTLIFSILVGIFTNVFLSRYLLMILIRTEMVNKPILYGVKESGIHA
jgi:preprotein translocase subunit SecD